MGFGGGAVAGVVGAAGIAITGAYAMIMNLTRSDFLSKERPISNGFAFLLFSGALSGVVQVGKGVVAVPQQVLAPMRGKWWNEQEGRWVLTDMVKDAQSLQDVPADDSDILGKIKADLDQQTTAATINDETTVADKILYDALEISPDADQSTIKRKYYLLARKYHPDKNPNDKEAAEKFKTISEAYSVLSDPAMRQKYNKLGRDVLKNDPNELTPMVEPKVLFAFLFGSDKFQHVFGRLATATSTSIGDSEEISTVDARKLQKRRVTRLAIKLIERITPWVKERQSAAAEASSSSTNNPEDSPIAQAWKKEGEDLCTASFGYPLVHAVGEAYYLVATMYAGSLESGHLPSISKWVQGKKAKLDKQRVALQNRRKQFTVGLKMVEMESKLQQQLEEAKTDEERQKVMEDAEAAATEMIVRALWTTTVVDITSTLYETCQMVFNDQSVDKNERKYRAKAVALLGKLWMDTPEPPHSSEEEMNYKQLYEEAAFAAMTETLKRKGEGDGQTAETT